MATRNKIYYPKSHIIENLHTSGGEWMLESGTEYVGYYHRYIDGTVMTGAVYNKTESNKLIPYISSTAQPDNKVYSSLKSRLGYISPHISYPIPALEDYEFGKFVRYFIRRRNSSTYEDIMEINKDQFILWKNPNGGIDPGLYDAIAIDWKLTGPMHDTVSGDDVIAGVYDTNLRMVQLKDQQFWGLRNYLTDYIELSIYSTYVDKKYRELFGNYK